MSLPWRDADPSDFCASDVPTATQRAAVILRTWAVFALSGVLSIPRHSRTTRNNVLLSSPRVQSIRDLPRRTALQHLASLANAHAAFIRNIGVQNCALQLHAHSIRGTN